MFQISNTWKTIFMHSYIVDATCEFDTIKQLKEGEIL